LKVIDAYRDFQCAGRWVSDSRVTHRLLTMIVPMRVYQS
jgi:hypothetical protein